MACKWLSSQSHPQTITVNTSELIRGEVQQQFSSEELILCVTVQNNIVLMMLCNFHLENKLCCAAIHWLGATRCTAAAENVRRQAGVGGRIENPNGQQWDLGRQQARKLISKARNLLHLMKWLESAVILHTVQVNTESFIGSLLLIQPAVADEFVRLGILFVLLWNFSQSGNLL